MHKSFSEEKTSSFNKSKHKSIELKGAIELEYHLISSQELHEIKEYSDSSSKFNYSLFLFGLCFTIIIALLTCDIENDLIHTLLICGACISFTTAAFCFWLHSKGNKRISQLVEKIKNTKTTIL